MIHVNDEKKIMIQYKQKVTTTNKKYGYKEITIPSDVYNLWLQQYDNEDFKEVSIITITAQTLKEEKTIITPCQSIQQEDLTRIIQDDDMTYKITTLRLRINKSRKQTKGKIKQKTTMSLKDTVNIIDDSVVFCIDPYQHDIQSDCSGLCFVRGLYVK